MTLLQPAVNDLLLGTDLVFVSRLQKSYERYGHGLMQKLLTPGELAYCLSENAKNTQVLRRFAGRIAVKEAVSKALGTGLNGLGWGQGIDWKEIEVVSERNQPPQLALSGKALDEAKRLHVADWRLSLSHDGAYAMATVVGLVGLPPQ